MPAFKPDIQVERRHAAGNGAERWLVSLVNPDGSVHTLKWNGIIASGADARSPARQRHCQRPAYVVDIDTVRWFNMQTGQPLGSAQVTGATRLNDLEVAADGTIYATQTGEKDPGELEGLQGDGERGSRPC